MRRPPPPRRRAPALRRAGDRFCCFGRMPRQPFERAEQLRLLDLTFVEAAAARGEIAVKQINVPSKRGDRRLALLRLTSRGDALLPDLLKLRDKLVRRVRCPCRRGQAQSRRRDDPDAQWKKP